MTSRPPGPYQLQAAIAAVHDEAAESKDTDWPQILALYDVLTGLADNPMVQLNRAVALAMVQGPRAGLAALAALAGDLPGAASHYHAAAQRTTSLSERDYLLLKAMRLANS